MFSFFYWIACFIAYICVQPVLLALCFKTKYKTSLGARFWLRNNKIPQNAQIWIHACSLGEITSLKPIIENLCVRDSGFSQNASFGQNAQDSRDSSNAQDSNKIIISTITQTGFSRAHELFGAHKNISICYLPFEIFLPFLMPKNLQKLIVLEAELWFMLFFCAKKNGARTILLNARISQKSAPSYRKNRWFYHHIFANIDIVLCQQERDKVEFEGLGAQKIEVIGNIKALNVPHASKNLARFSGVLFVAASTHEGEEELIIESYIKSYPRAGALNADEKSQRAKDSRLIIAPRHPERFARVWALMQKYSLKSARVSDLGLNFEYDMLLLDCLGELINFYAIADVVILGGSFVEVGGHNPLECAHFGAKIITGKHIFNQLALFSMVENAKIIENSELEATLKNIDTIAPSRIKKINLDEILRHIWGKNG